MPFCRPGPIPHEYKARDAANVPSAFLCARFHSGIHCAVVFLGNSPGEMRTLAQSRAFHCLEIWYYNSNRAWDVLCQPPQTVLCVDSRHTTPRAVPSTASRHIPCLCSLATPLPAQASETPAAAKGKAAAATAGVTYELYVDGGAAGCAAPTASGELARTCLCS